MKNATIWGILLILLAPLALGAELTSLTLHAPSIQQGEEITLSYTLVDDNTLGKVTTDVFLSGSINHRKAETVRGNRYQHTQTFILPQSHDSQDEVRVRIDVDGEFPIIATLPLREQAREQNTQVRNIQTYSDEDLVIVVDPIRDILRGENVYYRTQIYNTGDQDKVVTIGLSDVGSWATYRVDPQPTVRIPAESMHEAYIYLKVDPNAQPGITYFDVTARHDGQMYAQGVKIAVLQPLEDSQSNIGRWIIAVALLLLIIALILVLLTRNKNRPDTKGGDNDDFITYY